MAIQTKIVNGSFTEIYAGGGNFITQSTPTNFHQFYTQKILTPNENIEDYREVTASERTALEKSDAAWEEPPQGFIDECETAGAVYNRSTGFFELNGLTDLTYKSMRAVMHHSVVRANSVKGLYAHKSIPSSVCRTLLTTITFGHREDYSAMYQFCSGLETIRIECGYGKDVAVSVSNLYYFCGGCYSLREVYGVFSLQTANAQTPTDGTPNLEGFYIKNLHGDLKMDAPKWRLDCIEYAVANATNTGSITITLHPAAYARLTDELIAAAAEKNITFATA